MRRGPAGVPFPARLRAAGRQSPASDAYSSSSAWGGASWIDHDSSERGVALSGRCVLCRSRRELSNEALIAKFGVDDDDCIFSFSLGSFSTRYNDDEDDDDTMMIDDDGRAC